MANKKALSRFGMAILIMSIIIILMALIFLAYFYAQSKGFGEDTDKLVDLGLTSGSSQRGSSTVCGMQSYDAALECARCMLLNFEHRDDKYDSELNDWEDKTGIYCNKETEDWECTDDISDYSYTRCSYEWKDESNNLEWMGGVDYSETYIDWDNVADEDISYHEYEDDYDSKAFQKELREEGGQCILFANDYLIYPKDYEKLWNDHMLFTHGDSNEIRRNWILTENEEDSWHRSDQYESFGGKYPTSESFNCDAPWGFITERTDSKFEGAYLPKSWYYWMLCSGKDYCYYDDYDNYLIKYVSFYDENRGPCVIMGIDREYQEYQKKCYDYDEYEECKDERDVEIFCNNGAFISPNKAVALECGGSIGLKLSKCQRCNLGRLEDQQTPRENIYCPVHPIMGTPDPEALGYGGGLPLKENGDSIEWYCQSTELQDFYRTDNAFEEYYRDYDNEDIFSLYGVDCEYIIEEAYEECGGADDISHLRKYCEDRGRLADTDGIYCDTVEKEWIIEENSVMLDEQVVEANLARYVYLGAC